jgi:hypothetical protein
MIPLRTINYCKHFPSLVHPASLHPRMLLVDNLRPSLRQRIVCPLLPTRIISPRHPTAHRSRNHVRKPRRILVDQRPRTNHPSHPMNYQRSLYQVISSPEGTDEFIHFSPDLATIDTEHLSSQVRELLSANSIGQRVFGRLSIFLSFNGDIIAVSHVFRRSSIKSIAGHRQ